MTDRQTDGQAAGVDPHNINYIQAEMMDHLVTCLCKGKITPFQGILARQHLSESAP